MSVWVEIILLLIIIDLLKVTLHVSVWVEIYNRPIYSKWPQSRSTWACELKLKDHYCKELSKSHAPRERVSWNTIHSTNKPLPTSHAPRERVSWNIMLNKKITKVLVTLHVSVWVEIWIIISKHILTPVTLHVSVWVEMGICLTVGTTCVSRSTWACELKCQLHLPFQARQGSRSTWACELKFCQNHIYK